MGTKLKLSGFASNASVDGRQDGTASWWGNYGEGYSADWGKKPQTFEVKPELAGLNINDLLETANAGFTASKQPAFIYNVPARAYVQSSDTFMVVREDTWEEIGPRVGPDYTVVQHADALIHILGDIREQLGGIPTRVLSMENGRRVVIQCALPATFWVSEKDQHGLFLNIWNSHDGKGGLGGNTVDFRIICANTYAFAERSALNRFFTKHTKNVASRLAKLAEAAGLLRQQYQGYAEALFGLTQKEADGVVLDQFLKALIPDAQAEEGKRLNAGPANRRAEIGGFILKSAGRELTYDSLFQGVTGYVDRRSQNRNAEEQTVYALEGSGQDLKAQAWNWLTTN